MKRFTRDNFPFVASEVDVIDFSPINARSEPTAHACGPPCFSRDLERGSQFTAEVACAPSGSEYLVFFNVRSDKANPNSVTLIVQSAYFGSKELGPRTGRRKPVRFGVILLNTLLGKPLREPP